jgi:hypothetical protein
MNTEEVLIQVIHTHIHDLFICNVSITDAQYGSLSSSQLNRALHNSNTEASFDTEAVLKTVVSQVDEPTYLHCRVRNHGNHQVYRNTYTHKRKNDDICSTV